MSVISTSSNEVWTGTWEHKDEGVLFCKGFVMWLPQRLLSFTVNVCNTSIWGISRHSNVLQKDAPKPSQKDYGWWFLFSSLIHQMILFILINRSNCETLTKLSSYVPLNPEHLLHFQFTIILAARKKSHKSFMCACERFSCLGEILLI